MRHDFPTRLALALMLLTGLGGGLSASEAADRKRARQPVLEEFVLGDGCRLRASDAAVRRFRETAAQGSVVWEGRCENRYINGIGVLRQEGIAVRDGRKIRYAHHFSGTAIEGRRIGRWRRESFSQVEGADVWWANIATLDFIGGVSMKSSEPREAPVESYSAAMRGIIAQAETRASAGRTAASTGKPAPPSVLRGAELAASVVSTKASARYQTYGPEGLLGSVEPGWHAAPLQFPITLDLEFRAPAEVARIGLLPQAGHTDRAPGEYIVSVSDDGIQWRELVRASGDCANADSQQWREAAVGQPVPARWLRISILSNCGHPGLMTLRGLRLG